MAEQIVPKLEILVAGDPGNGKENLIKRFLEYFPATAEACRKNVTVHFLYDPDTGLKIQLYDVNNVDSIDCNAYGKMDVVLFYYVAHDPESLQSLEKWILLMEQQKMEPSRPRTKNEAHSFLVADWSDVGNQRNMSELKYVSEIAEKLKGDYGVQLFIQSSLEDQESAFRAFEIIMSEVSPPILDEETCEEYFEPRISERIRKDLVQYSNLSRPTSSSCGDRHLEAIRTVESSFEGLAV